ncbi:MAG TPA: hypothetical protein VMJ10_23255 [Kofleriaceae bacterium]|nr:hypothetical protein [Kofleriaceae bacterium]
MKSAALCLVLAAGCEVPTTTVAIENRYPTSGYLVVYQAFWQAVRFTEPVAPGTSSDPQNTVPASDNTAYALLAPGWEPESMTPPTSFVVLQSTSGFAVDLDSSLVIPIDDTTFAGNCAAGSHLDQQQTDFIATRVFQTVFAGRAYDAATCTTEASP